MNLPGKFTWFEHLSDDPAKAQTFYEGLFGWTVSSMPIEGAPYLLVHNAGEAIGGLVPQPAGTRARWLGHLSVGDIDGAYANALSQGAKPLAPPADYGGMGRGPRIADPAGAELSLWTPVRGDRADVEKTPAGDWVWNELMTPDPGAAVAFYEKSFGFTHERMDMGAQGIYLILKSPDGQSRAGVMKAPHAGMPAMWTPYVHVEQADKTAARVAPLGGTLVLQPLDIPTIGRIAMLQDPLGAAIAFIQPAVMG